MIRFEIQKYDCVKEHYIHCGKTQLSEYSIKEFAKAVIKKFAKWRQPKFF